MKRFVLTALCFAASLPSVASAQAWIRDPGSFYVNLGYRTIGADRFYNPDGDVIDQEDYRQHSVTLYAEAGIVDRWLMATLEGELYRRNVLTDNAAVSGLGDLSIGLWTGLLEGPVNLSFGIKLGIPTGDPVPSSGTDDVLQNTTAQLLPTGDGEFDVTPQLNLGYGFRWLRVDQFVQLSAGYAIRTTPRETSIGDTQDIRDQFVYRAETGIRIDHTFIRRFWFIIRLAGQLVVQGRDEGFSRFGPAGLGDGVEFAAIGFETLFDVYGGFGLGFGVDGAIAARNVTAGAAYKVSLTYEFR